MGEIGLDDDKNALCYGLAVLDLWKIAWFLTISRLDHPAVRKN